MRLFGLTLFLSAACLFAVEPMIARMLLPRVGGAAAAWSTCLVFYQAALLLGYLYAYHSARRSTIRTQVIVHVVVLAGAALVLPIGPGQFDAPAAGTDPTAWLLGNLGLTVGLPFVALSATTPLVQSWFARVRPDANPYALYSASNLGSFIGLIAYPVFIEPLYPLEAQSRFWAAGYVLAALFIAACGTAAVRSAARKSELGSLKSDRSDVRLPPSDCLPASSAVVQPVTARARLHWLWLAALPASLTLSVTTYLSTDIAAVPLLWILPLSLYLASLVVAFARPDDGRAVHWLLPTAALVPIASILTRTGPLWLHLPAHLLAFFVVSLACHQALARRRPHLDRLPEFYVWLSLGGAIGGLITALVAPLVFVAPLEYPLGLLLACYAGLRATRTPGRRLAGMIGAAAAAALAIVLAGAGAGIRWASTSLAAGATIHAERSFYGIHRVQADGRRRFHIMVDGTTVHGIQALDPMRRRDCLGYYSPAGPLGQAIKTLQASRRLHDVAVLGLGTGALACHAAAGEQWTFFEIDPSVVALARNERYFSYLAEAPVRPSVIVGDARISLTREVARPYDLIAVDAFSSDSIPVHLITREALGVYLDRLAPGGVIAFNVSNRYVNLRAVVAALAREGQLAAVAARHEVGIDLINEGVFSSEWVLVAKDRRDLAGITEDSRWQPADAEAMAVWTDDHAPLVTAIKWGW